jgi:CRP-like cAMP-binding protein
VRWRQTTLETLDGDLVVVPNIILMKSSVTLLGRAESNTRYRAVPFNVYYDSTPGEVTAAVDRAFREDPPPNVAAKPAPYCGIKDFLPNCVAYEVRYYLSDLASPGRTDSEVRSKIFYALSRAGIRLSVPSRSMVLSEAALKGVDVFQSLTPAEFETLAARLRPSPFSDGELLMRQGAAADWLYIIYEGKAEVRLYSGTESFRVVKTVGEGAVLGEMGLLTGEPRTATAVAAGEARCYRLDHDGFRAVLAARPEIAKGIASLLARRKVELDAAREKLAGDAAAGLLKNEEQNLLSRIRNFFSL